MSPMERTLKALRNEGKLCGIVERFVHNRHVQHRSDLFGIFDILAVCQNSRTVIGVQVCGPDVSSHYRKITIEKKETTALWLYCGGAIEIWGWRKILMRKGLKRKVWQPRRIYITENDLKGGDECTESARTATISGSLDGPRGAVI